MQLVQRATEREAAHLLFQRPGDVERQIRYKCAPAPGAVVAKFGWDSTVRSVLGSYGVDNEWWRGEPPYVTLTGGAVSTWTGSLLGKTVTDAGVAGQRPAYNGTIQLTFNGTSNFLYGSLGFLNGATQFTFIAVCTYANTATGEIVEYDDTPGGLAVGRATLRNSATALLSLIEKDAATFNYYTSTVDRTGVRAMFAARGNFALGVNAASPPWMNTAALASTHTSALDVTGGTLGNWNVSFGASVGGTLFASMTVTDMIVAPHAISDADLTTIYNAFVAASPSRGV